MPIRLSPVTIEVTPANGRPDAFLANIIFDWPLAEGRAQRFLISTFVTIPAVLGNSETRKPGTVYRIPAAMASVLSYMVDEASKKGTKVEEANSDKE